MVEVRFACIPGVGGVKCTLDGVVKYSDSTGIASFFGVSQGAHSYSIEAPRDMVLVSGEDPFGRPLYDSGTTVIEWALLPGTPWPEANPWMMMFTFAEEEEVPPEERPEISNTLGKIGAVVGTLGLLGVFIDSARKR